VIRHEQAESEIRVGTVVRVPSRNLAKAEFDDETDVDEEADDDWRSPDSPRSIPDAKSRFLQIATDYAWLNPNAAITVEWFGKRTSVAVSGRAGREQPAECPCSKNNHRNPRRDLPRADERVVSGTTPALRRVVIYGAFEPLHSVPPRWCLHAAERVGMPDRLRRNQTLRALSSANAHLISFANIFLAFSKVIGFFGDSYFPRRWR
jgi:hypothetical protein